MSDQRELIGWIITDLEVNPEWTNEEILKKHRDLYHGLPDSIIEQKIDKIKDIITLFDKSLEFNMLGIIDIKSVNKRLKDIIE